jgi:dinuclear metal center YbgI/SA1388 family protein
MHIKTLIQYLEQIAPASLQESYDNAGLIVGDPNQTLTGVLVCLDCLEAVVDEAIALGCNLIVAHHPIVFSGLKKINGKNYVERVVIKAIQNNIALYAIHTNLDNVYHQGVNGQMAKQLGLNHTRILSPKTGQLRKLVSFVPESHHQAVLQALFQAGAGNIGNYSECSFSQLGQGSFKPNKAAQPFLGQANQREEVSEQRIEVIFPLYAQGQVLQALRQSHPYEEVAYDLINLENEHPLIGSGLIGQLPEAQDSLQVLQQIKQAFGAGVVRHTQIHKKQIQTIALCGGSGSFLLKTAIQQGADLFLTADFKYHEFFDAEQKIIIADIGHFESEQFTIALVCEIIQKKFPNFAVHQTKVNTNPVRYL